MPLDDLLAKGWTFADDESPTSPPPPRFSDADISALKERRRLAKASPLRKQAYISFSLPSLYPEAVYSPDIAPFPSPNRLRQASSTLLREWADSAKTGTAEIKLVKGTHKGSDEEAQVWRAEARVGGRRRKVVVKLFAEALFSIPIGTEEGWWQPGERKAEQEAQGYTSFRSTQGLDVPICYGFYLFDVPWGEKVIGVILEDLTETATPLWRWGQEFLRSGEDSDVEEVSSESDEEGGEEVRNGEMRRSEVLQNTKRLERFILRLYECQRRLHSLDHTTIASGGGHVLVLKSSTPDDPRFVTLSFSRTSTRFVEEKRALEDYKDLEQRHGAEVAKAHARLDYRYDSEEGMKQAVEAAFGEQIEKEWRGLTLFEFA